jgi:hypothetical protein
MNTLYFTLALKFESSIVDDNDIVEVTDNIGRALLSEADCGIGLAPKDGDTYTTEIFVKPEYSDYQYHKVL